ncbi:MAG: hypothetical protein AAF447_16175 [Myxococcota bacterium]
MLSTQARRSSSPLLLLAGLLLAGACGGDSAAGGDDAGVDMEVDAGPELSELYGPCTMDSDCEGPDPVCLTVGYPGGLCSRACFIDATDPDVRDATNCLQTFPNGTQRFGACVQVDGEDACLPICVADIDCGGGALACVTLRPAPGASTTVDVCRPR